MNSYKSSCTPKTISKATQHLQKKKKRVNPSPSVRWNADKHPKEIYPLTNGLQTYSI